MSKLPEDACAFVDQIAGANWQADALHGDASVRGYFRIRQPGGQTFMLAYYPEAVRDGVGRFLAAYQALAEHALLPEVLGSCETAVIQQDIGDATLFELLFKNRNKALDSYREAVDVLVQFQRASRTASELNPPFDENKFFSELEMTLEFYVGQMMGRSNPEAMEALRNGFHQLSHRLTRHPYVLCHRDFHGQNIHIFKDKLYLIDYQDTRMGPDTYDVASLIRDRGVTRILGEDQEHQLVDYYRARTGADEHILSRYYETLLQRSIKVVGTFARQALTRGRKHYLDYIPPALESIRLCLDELPEYRPLLGGFPLEFGIDPVQKGQGRSNS